ncbi:MAG: hypothetical protein ACLRZ9_04990 [Eubacterium sp.]
MRKKVVAYGLVVSMLIPNIYSVKAEEIVSDTVVIEVSNSKELSEVDSNGIVVIESENLDNLKKDEIIELLDDGGTIFVSGDCEEQVIDYFDDSAKREESDILLGYKITKNGNNIEYTPVDAEIAVEEDSGERISDEDYASLKNVTLTDEDYEYINEDTETVVIDKLSDESKANLQASSTIGKGYGDASHTTYYYRKSKWNWKTECVSKKSKAEKGWEQIGKCTLTITAYNAGSKKEKTFDAIYTTAIVSGSGDRKIKEFTLQNRLYKGTKAKIVDVTKLKGGR